uniref:Uncharacterized protein n=1 Tax=Arundo donax TaxID=35708 RepID=A0A0A9DIK3_ARUDO
MPRTTTPRTSPSGPSRRRPRAALGIPSLAAAAAPAPSRPTRTGTSMSTSSSEQAT